MSGVISLTLKNNMTTMTMTCEKYKVTHADYHELQRKQQEYPINIKKAAMTGHHDETSACSVPIVMSLPPSPFKPAGRLVMCESRRWKRSNPADLRIAVTPSHTRGLPAYVCLRVFLCLEMSQQGYKCSKTTF